MPFQVPELVHGGGTTLAPDKVWSGETSASQPATLWVSYFKMVAVSLWQTWRWSHRVWSYSSECWERPFSVWDAGEPSSEVTVLIHINSSSDKGKLFKCVPGKKNEAPWWTEGHMEVVFQFLLYMLNFLPPPPQLPSLYKWSSLLVLIQESGTLKSSLALLELSTKWSQWK